ncbi:MAG: hypothetical protein AB7E96_00300 [Deferribacterales bacterium]
MRTLFASFAALLLLSCAASGTAIHYSEHELYLRDYIWRVVADAKKDHDRVMMTPQNLRPEPDDFKIFEADLNGDGRLDFIASTYHYLFSDNRTYPLYVMIKDDYSYTMLPDTPRIPYFDIKSLPDMTNGYHDIAIAGKVYKFDGTTYKEVN